MIMRRSAELLRAALLLLWIRLVGLLSLANEL